MKQWSTTNCLIAQQLKHRHTTQTRSPSPMVTLHNSLNSFTLHEPNVHHQQLHCTTMKTTSHSSKEKLHYQFSQNTSKHLYQNFLHLIPCKKTAKNNLPPKIKTTEDFLYPLAYSSHPPCAFAPFIYLNTKSLTLQLYNYGRKQRLKAVDNIDNIGIMKSTQNYFKN